MSRKQQENSRKKTESIPSSPGVYMMKDRRGEIIYVGKAKNLASRVSSYFGDGGKKDTKTMSLIRCVDKIDYIATDNEIEALVLENTLIKEHHPHYNIQLKNGNRYPYIKLTVRDKYPRLMLVRKIENDGSEYFGPFTDVGAVRSTLRFLGEVFPLRTCSDRRLNAKEKRECLNYHIKRCTAPCTGKISEEEYSKIVSRVRLFLKGKNSELLRYFETDMKRLSDKQKYEKAAAVRDKMEAIQKLSQKQLAVSVEGRDEDVISIAREGSKACGVVMRVREGRILGTEAFILNSDKSSVLSDIQDTFLKLYYHSATDVPGLILVENKPVDKHLLQQWLSVKAGKKVKIEKPERGSKRGMIKLAAKNASLKLFSNIKPELDVSNTLRELSNTLNLHTYPYRVEAYDISNIQGAEAVGSMVTFINGKPSKSDYRRFRIKSVKGIDDYAMLTEVLIRRLRLLEDSQRRPDLLLIDGGKGQVNSVLKVMIDSGFSDIPVAGLAKRNEEIYIGGEGEKLSLPGTNPTLRFLQRVRDEAHRFAVEYHRKLMKKRMKHSILDEISGIGEKRKTRLLVKFGSVEEMRKASVEEISLVKGIGERYAKRIYRYLHKS